DVPADEKGQGTVLQQGGLLRPVLDELLVLLLGHVHAPSLLCPRVPRWTWEYSSFAVLSHSKNAPTAQCRRRGRGKRNTVRRTGRGPSAGAGAGPDTAAPRTPRR